MAKSIVCIVDVCSDLGLIDCWVTVEKGGLLTAAAEQQARGKGYQQK